MFGPVGNLGAGERPERGDRTRAPEGAGGGLPRGLGLGTTRPLPGRAQGRELGRSEKILQKDGSKTGCLGTSRRSAKALKFGGAGHGAASPFCGPGGAPKAYERPPWARQGGHSTKKCVPSLPLLLKMPTLGRSGEDSKLAGDPGRSTQPPGSVFVLPSLEQGCPFPRGLAEAEL